MATKNVQIRIDEDLHKTAKISLAKINMSWQEFLEEYIKLKFGKGKQNGPKK